MSAYKVIPISSERCLSSKVIVSTSNQSLVEVTPAVYLGDCAPLMGLVVSSASVPPNVPAVLYVAFNPDVKEATAVVSKS